jgi:hypothetical protein
MLVFDFSLAGFPKLKKKARRVDGFTAGVVALPGVETASGLSGSSTAVRLRERVQGRLPRWR